VEKSPLDPFPGKPSATPDGAKAKVGKTVGQPMEQAAEPRIPRGPFKTLTIPESWYNSLHATAGTDDIPEGEHD